MTPEELNRLRTAIDEMARSGNAAGLTAQQLGQALQRLGLTAESAEETVSDLGRSFGGLTGRVSPLAAGINALAQSVMGYIGVQMRLTQSMLSFQNQIYDTEDVFANMNTGITKQFAYVEDAVKSTLGPFAALAKDIPIIGSLLTATGKAVAAGMDVVKANNDLNMKVIGQSFKAMQNLTGSFGALTLDVEKFSQEAGKAGLTSDQFSRMLTTNAKSLSTVFGGASRAASALQTEFSVLNREGNTTRATFVAMGLSQDDMAEAMTEYANNQRLLGRRQGYETGELSTQTLKYQKNLAAISAITGENAKQQQAERSARLNQAQFAAKIEKLTIEGKLAEAAALQEAVTAAAEYGPAFEKVAIEQAVYGRVITAEASKTMMMNRALGEASQNAIDGTKGFTGSVEEAQRQSRAAFDEKKDEIKAGRDASGSLAMLAGLTDNAFIQDLGATFVATRDTVAKTGTLVDEFNTALRNLVLTEQGGTALIAAEDARQQAMRVKSENNSITMIDNTLKIATAFSDLAEALEESRTKMVQKLTGFTNDFVDVLGSGFTPEKIDKLHKQYLLATDVSKSDGGKVSNTADHGVDDTAYFLSTGGIAKGPDTGYRATLHGTEAVVPLPDGKSIPVTLDTSGFDQSVTALLKSMELKTPTNDNLASLMEQSVALNSEILDTLKQGNRTGQRMVKALS